MVATSTLEQLTFSSTASGAFKINMSSEASSELTVHQSQNRFSSFFQWTPIGSNWQSFRFFSEILNIQFLGFLLRIFYEMTCNEKVWSTAPKLEQLVSGKMLAATWPAIPNTGFRHEHFDSTNAVMNRETTRMTSLRSILRTDLTQVHSNPS